MKRRHKIVRTIIGLLIFPLAAVGQGLGLEECHRLANENYPLLRKYDIINKVTDFTVDNIKKGYLPQVAVGGQVTYQSDVMALPDALKGVLASNGFGMKGMEKDQYKISVDVSQILYDGGNIRASKDVAYAESEKNSRQIDVEMYALRDRVDNLFFGILLVDERLKLNEELKSLLSDNCRKLETMLSKGVVTQSDVDAMRAEYLNACQKRTDLESVRESYSNMLALFIGRKVDGALMKPSASAPVDNGVMRPELQLFDAQRNLNDAQRKLLDAGIRPTVSLFAQGYYGYPGYDMFKSMSDHDWTLNGMIGVRLSWNIGKLYTYKNDHRKLDVLNAGIENARDVFLFNNSLQSAGNRTAIDRYKKMMDEDNEIIKLRTSVRKAAEAKLDHGIIDVNDLLQEITRENSARIDQSTHEVEMLKSIHELRNTLNQ